MDMKKMRMFIQKDTDSEAKEPGTTQHSYWSIKAFNLLIRQNTVAVKDFNY